MPDTIEISLTVLREKILDYLDHGQASLKTQDAAHAKRGLTAVAQAKCLAELVTTHAKVADQSVQQIAALGEQAIKLMAAYWADFGLVLLKRSGSEQSVVVQVAPAPQQRRIINLGKENQHKMRGRGKTITPEKRARVEELIRNAPSDASKTEWYMEIAKTEGMSFNSVVNINTRMRASQNGHRS